jgi:negative regulator of sigma-B (phosphoserine phosphatase)
MASIAGAYGHERSIIEWASAGVALDEHLPGSQSGDLHAIVHFPDGVLVAVIDGLGHGPEAAFAAREAARLLEAGAGESVIALVQRCHDGLRRTRGVVMSLASFTTRDSSMTWTGIGNVEGVLVRAGPTRHEPREVITSRGGVIGYQLPPLRATRLSVSPGDMLIMATDGVQSGFTAGLSATRSPQDLADSIMALYRKGSDDALVVVARYVGGTE